MSPFPFVINTNTKTYQISETIYLLNVHIYSCVLCVLKSVLRTYINYVIPNAKVKCTSIMVLISN